MIEKLTINQKETKTSKFGLFYKHKDEKSHFIPLMRKYRSVDIQYIQDIKKNKFKLKNIIKLSTSIKRTRKAAKNLRIGTSRLEIEIKEEDCTTTNIKSIILLLRVCHIYAQTLIFLATLGNKLQIQLALGKYVKHLIIL